MTTSNKSIITESIMTPITVDKAEMERLIKSAIARHPKKITVSDHYFSVFIKMFLEHLANGFEPLVQSAIYLGKGNIDMTKPVDVLEEEHKQLTLKVTKEYEDRIASKEESRKVALKKEQRRIRAERDQQAFEDKILNAKG